MSSFCWYFDICASNKYIHDDFVVGCDFAFDEFGEIIVDGLWYH